MWQNGGHGEVLWEGNKIININKSMRQHSLLIVPTENDETHLVICLCAHVVQMDGARVEPLRGWKLGGVRFDLSGLLTATPAEQTR